jgi:mono/diheme cytochrome c family protein
MKDFTTAFRKVMCKLLLSWCFIVLFFVLSDSPLCSQSLPDGYNELFAGSGECAVCHNSQISPDGFSVAIADDWRSTMMANASRDPLWRAKVSAEVDANPMHKEFIEDKCSKCHAPAGNVNIHHLDGGNYLLANLYTDPFGLDGVQCTICHQITPSSMGTNSAAFTIGTEKIIYGPYQAPFAGPMVNFTAYTPMFSDHINNSELCGTCHTLLTHPVSPEGEVYENEFVEQSILQEWKNSIYPDENTNCQTCHIPRISGPVTISNTPPWLDGQDFFGQHHFVGANIFMNRIFQENAEDLDLTASLTQLQNTESRTNLLLQEKAVTITVDELERNENSLTISLELKNLGGHKLPAGFPSRRVFIEFIAVDALGDTILHSGKTTPDFRIIGEDSGYEPHHEVISGDNQVQIYEMVMGDVAGNPTTELLSAHSHLKDNRLPPKGFTSGHISYDTVRIAGSAIEDPDFNRRNGLEGSGSDLILYDIPITNNLSGYHTR